MALTRTDCMAAISAVLFLALLGGESALVAAPRGLERGPAARETLRVVRDENPFIDSGAHQAYLARTDAALQPRIESEQKAAPQNELEMEYR